MEGKLPLIVAVRGLYEYLRLVLGNGSTFELFKTNTVAVCRQGEGDKGKMKVDEFAKMINDEVNEMIKDF